MKNQELALSSGYDGDHACPQKVHKEVKEGVIQAAHELVFYKHEVVHEPFKKFPAYADNRGSSDDKQPSHNVSSHHPQVFHE